MRHWIYGALALGAALSTPESTAAVVTAKVTLNATTWTDLGAGPAMVSGNVNVVFAIGDASPTTPLSQGFTFVINQCVNTTSHVWAMAINTPTAFVFVAPIVGC